ncbi:methionine aminopeptidase [Naegleria gruberi]|uniref:Methionine aminopeptidase 2 n=1 Tax=Naegleria gruberi TaxID=5762 RepID=D2V3S4_NAEGR|nr:methionine aminopeptidase [Naegleria gruberi]EFC48405.1 methionine aminopeptidase [Naegleria gruberi]|eukprot:XP_002681149.1 methionine aminopeptidase [Naegleria gruberi strain NEG-M]
MSKKNEKESSKPIPSVNNHSNKQKVWPTEQTQPEPTVPIKHLYKDGKFPEGEICELGQYDYKTKRFHPSELKPNTEEREEKLQEQLMEARQAAEVHRTARKWFKDSVVKPGMKVIDAAEMYEAKVRELLEADKKKSGLAFPLGCSINHVAAHYSPNGGDETLIGKDDVIKFDLGTHVNGTIIDSAFTMCWNDQYQPLLDAVKEATNMGVRTAGIDVRLGDVGAAIQEVMESYEVIINGKTHRVKSIQNLCGHSIERYHVHAGKSVPIVASSNNTKMEENEFFAIETFGSTGKGYVIEEGVCSHYGRKFTYNGDGSELKNKESRELLKVINDHFGSIPFCRRYLDRTGQKKYLTALRDLVNNGIVNEYPPFVDVKGCYTAQFEHTIFLRPTCKEVLSRGSDY